MKLKPQESRPIMDSISQHTVPGNELCCVDEANTRQTDAPCRSISSSSVAQGYSYRLAGTSDKRCKKKTYK